MGLIKARKPRDSKPNIRPVNTKEISPIMFLFSRAAGFLPFKQFTWIYRIQPCTGLTLSWAITMFIPLSFGLFLFVLAFVEIKQICR